VIRDGDEDDDRRAFLKTCGRFAAVTPPVMTLLLSTSLTSTAIARSGGQNGVTHGDDRGPSFFDNDRPSSAASGSSGSGSPGGGDTSGGGRRGSSGAGGQSGGGGGSGGATGKGPFSTASSGSPSASGAVDCADEDDEERKRKPECERVTTRVSIEISSER
jgi:hypothetical protein